MRFPLSFEGFFFPDFCTTPRSALVLPFKQLLPLSCAGSSGLTIGQPASFKQSNALKTEHIFTRTNITAFNGVVVKLTTLW